MTALWVDEPWLSLDCETTGVDVFADRIVEIAAVLVRPDGTTIESYRTIVNPGIEIPAGAAAIHGITTERARDEGVTPAAALTEVASRIFAHGYRPVVGFNMVFDWPICISEAERHGIEFPAIAPVLDPFLVDRMLDKFRKGSRKLLDVAHHYAVDLDEADAHGALADAVAAARVMRAIVARYPQVGERTLASVYLRQVRGHEAWREGFIEYKRRTNAAFYIPPGWPIPARTDAGGLPVIDKAEPEVAPAPATPVQGGEEVAGAVGTPAASDTPVERPGITAKDVGILAGRVFQADYDAAPKGQKTKVVERLRHALTYACTEGTATSLNDLAPEQLLVVDRWLRHIRDQLVHYAADDEGVTFVLVSTGEEHPVAWADLEAATAA